MESDLHQEFQDDGVLIIGIEVWNGSESEVQEFVDNTGVTYTIAMEGLSVSREYEVENNHAVVVDAEGNVHSVISIENSRGREELIDAVQGLVDATPVLRPNQMQPKGQNTRHYSVLGRHLTDAQASRKYQIKLQVTPSKRDAGK